jgi:hypothetical protein
VISELPLLDVFYGELSVHRASIYARLPRPSDDAGLKVAGQVRGPRCRLAQTLPVNANLVDLGGGPTLLARAIMPEPNSWTPETPSIYDVTINLLQNGKILATARRSIGLRALGVRDRRFHFEGKNWVLRGVSNASTTATHPAEWHPHASAYIAEHHVERFVEASELGVLAIAHIDAHGDIPLQLRQLALHPAAALAVVRVPPGKQFKLTGIAPNILLAQTLPAFGPFKPQAWAQVIWAETTDPTTLANLQTMFELPIIAVRPLTTPESLPDARAACDELQRHLAPLGQFAGYVV